ncbi:MAG: amidohydrolase [Candidatus Omnitrophica bacterium]|nr:amidohydrolase [Candidatus Omnitrophota bacterium]MCM8828655.1 amidohydrolase [Candidatus Omnitrophota bacterium]
MIIDAHNHPEWHGHTIEKFIRNMDENQIDITWLLTWESPEDEYPPSIFSSIPCWEQTGPIPFSRVIEYIKHRPDRFVPGYAPDPRRPEAIDLLAGAISLYGVRVYGELKLRMMYDNPDAIRMFRFCGEKGLPVVVHIDYEFDTGSNYPRPSYWYGGGIEAFERAISKCPETNFLGHGPGFWAHISGDDKFDKEVYPAGKVKEGGKIIEMLHKYPNLYCDLSAGSGLNAIKRDVEFGKKFLVEFQDRILFARDYFDSLHREFLESLDLDSAVVEKIYYKNALKLVPLK